MSCFRECVGQAVAHQRPSLQLMWPMVVAAVAAEAAEAVVPVVVAEAPEPQRLEVTTVMAELEGVLFRQHLARFCIVLPLVIRNE
jgi:hypothetical protein